MELDMTTLLIYLSAFAALILAGYLGAKVPQRRPADAEGVAGHARSLCGLPHSYAALAERADAENRALRRLLAVRVSGASLYTDDGELQDNSQHPFIDYYCDSPAEIHRKLQERAAPAKPLEDRRCPHGIRHPHPCRECEDASLAPGWASPRQGGSNG